MTLLAVRLIDLAIFGSLGGLWIGGAIFIVLLYRWILRFEASGEPPVGLPAEPAPTREAQPTARPAVLVPQTTAAREALPSSI